MGTKANKRGVYQRIKSMQVREVDMEDGRRMVGAYLGDGRLTGVNSKS